jgi:hypothetical protein
VPLLLTLWLLTAEPRHPQYKKVLEHLGGIIPGESKPVSPFP